MSKKPSPKFDDTRQYKDDRYSKKEVKEYCSTCGEIHGSKCPEYYIIHKEEPKPECDHIVGLRNIFHINGGVQRGFIEVHRSDINGLMMLEYAFKECPECGEKLNLKKDEEL